MIRNLFCIVLVLATSPSSAEETTSLPLRKIVMFNSGLGYFQHERQVSGTVELEMRFGDGDINDLLKSLVVQDMGGGQIEAVSLPSRNPLSDQLRGFSVDLQSHPTLAELLHQLRGEPIRLDDKTTGTIVGVELKPQQVGEQVVNREVLNVLTDQGLRGVPLDSVSQVSLVNEELGSELREALQLLAASRRTDKKAVCFRFAGEGERNVRIGYIRETPIWKTSYRIVLNGGQPALLQGWAVVENAGDVDWNQVALTLTSGRPVTFQMDLYRSLFVERPKVAPSVPPSLVSRVYSPALEQLDMDQALPPGSVVQYSPTMPFTPIGPGYGYGMGSSGMGGMGGAAGFGGGGMGGGFGGGAGFGGGSGLGGAVGGSVGQPPDDSAGDAPFDAGQGVVAQASSSDIGEQFQYEIDDPVTLARKHSAMIPIVNQTIDAERLSVFTSGGDAQHPMLAFRLVNSTDLRLTGGPVTVFEDGVYAGDARMEFFRPGDKRLINYAQDIELAVRYRLEDETRKLGRAWLDLGVVRMEYELQREHRYRVQSSADDDRKLVLEQPRDDGNWDLRADQKPTEKTDSEYRFEFDVPAQQTIEFVVVEQNGDQQAFDLKNVELKELEGLARRQDLPAEVTDTIRQVRQLRLGIADLEAKLRLQDQLLSDIEAEQSRIRSNMSPLNRDSELYRRYVAKLTAQEDRFDGALQAIAQSRVKLAELKGELAKFFPSSADAPAASAPDENASAAGEDPFGAP